MLKRVMLVAAIALVAMTATSAQDAGGASAAGVIAAASKAMGADTLRTIEYSGNGYDFVLGQAYNPSSPWPRFVNPTYKRVIDFQVPSSRVDRVRIQAENPPRGGGQQPIRGEQPQTQTIIVGANTPWAQQLEIWMTPYGFLRAAAMNNATMRAQTIGGQKYSVVSFTGQNKAKVNGYINSENMVAKVETWIDDALFGDLLSDAVYSDYKDFGGVKFPTRIVQNQGGYPIFDLRISDVKPNALVTIQPAQGGGGGGGGAAAPAEAPTEKLADGVYLVSGGYAALVVDFKPYIVVIEGGQSEERSNAVIAAAKKLVPNKRIRYVVNTHHHIDHSRGLRRYVAEGATIVTHRINAPFFERVFAAPKTLNPDALSKAKREPTFETLTTKKVMTDGNHVIELHHMAGNGHNEGLILAYLPKQKLLVEADAYNPPAQPNAPVPMPVSPYTENLVATIDRLKLDVDTIVPIHLPADGRKVTRAELMRMAGR
jgi:glyoxylase-like metal-dependent hydrolase (beta-lactamase superfamily II)